ncbi:SixA phosphatase family protein [Gilvibacter sediminis]|uniref:SixA phosphatase family protein n=1 Tax=Gilvibacter sediminis TaxID=379071 RepID=UPI00234FC429|nr:phosphoglycerate mutase family protein [Gilvibacter sediminis]MDC7997875.1 phosphoglycerate mutase family protein [Gilvibacter sediminis]
MKSIATLIVFLTLCSPFNVQAQSSTEETTTVYYCIRHAEKDRSNPDNKNPDLTKAGLTRAENWAKVFATVDFDAVYSTDYNRTQQTAAPTAASQGLEVLSYDPSDLYNKDFAAATTGKTVLVVGHSNTTPVFVNAVLGEEKYPWMADDNNGGLYIVTKTGDTVSVQILQIN